MATSRHIKDRLERELERNLAMRLEETDTADKFIVYGRGAAFVRANRNHAEEGYELQIGQPQSVTSKLMEKSANL